MLAVVQATSVLDFDLVVGTFLPIDHNMVEVGRT